MKKRTVAVAAALLLTAALVENGPMTAHATAEQVVTATTVDGSFDQGWRKTRNGWERLEQFQKPTFEWSSPTSPHPAVVGLVQMALSVLALWIFQRPTHLSR